MTSAWREACAMCFVVLSVSACGTHKDIGGDSYQSDAMQSAIRDVRQKNIDVAAEVRATVRNMFGSSFTEEVMVVHIPMTILNTLEFELDETSGLYRMRKLFHPIGYKDTFTAHADVKSGQIFVDEGLRPRFEEQNTASFQVFLVTEEVPYTNDAEYYLSTVVDGLPYFYVVGVDLASAVRLGVTGASKVVASEDPEVYTIVILKKNVYGAVMDEVPVEP